MPFTAQELANIANSALDFYIDRGTVWPQSIQSKPLLKHMEAAKKTFPGGKENISFAVRFDYDDELQGFSGDDTVDYENDANVKRCNYPWKEIHRGLKFTGTELKIDGISVTDSTTGKNVSEHSGREETALANLLENKLDGLAEGYSRGKNLMYWKDGSQDAKQAPGIQSIILDDPTSAVVVGGLDQNAITLWRNRAVLAMSTADANNQLVVQTLQKEYRQLRRYGNPKHVLLAGSDFLDWVEKEQRAKGNYTLTGWAGKGGIDVAVDDPKFKGMTFEYDPTLDDLGRAKYCYFIDMNAIFPMVMEGEDDKRHAPSRPENKYVYYRAITWTGGIVAKRRNTSGVYSIA